MIYGYSRAEAVGRVTHDLLATVFPESEDAFDEALARHGRWEGELRHTRKDGRVIVITSRQALARDEHGQPLAIIELNSDITERKRAEEEREQALVELREAGADRADGIMALGSRPRAHGRGRPGCTSSMVAIPAGGPIGTDESFTWIRRRYLERVQGAYARMREGAERFELTSGS